MDSVFEEPEGVRLDRAVKHKVQLAEGAKPYQKVPFRLSPDQRELLNEKLQEFWARGWIQLSTSEWATMPIVVPKKDEPGRVCIDYRDLNAITAYDAYPLPKIDELLHKLARSRWYSKVDLKSGFHQIPMELRESTSDGISGWGAHSRMLLV